MTTGAIILYRIVDSNPPTLADMTSNAARGETLRDPTPERLRLWAGLSAFATEAQARRNARRYTRLGRFIATLGIPADAPVRIERTGRPGHHTVWGDPRYLLSCVAQVSKVT